MKILVVNAGSSSLKFTLFNMENGENAVLASGQVERIGSDTPNLIYKRPDGFKSEEVIKITNHGEALSEIRRKLLDPQVGVLKNLSEVAAIGHRVLHGGEKVTQPVLITQEVKDIIRECFPLGPLHNPANLTGIEACEKDFPGVPNVGVFDTQFHQTMPPEAYLYAIPYDYYKQFGIRKYGFHGTSHHYVTLSTAEFLGKKPEDTTIITCHLGNGCSITAVKDGVCVDTSMGFTPLDGFMMGTRSGTIDPSALTYIAEKEHLSPEDVNTICNKKSGMLGISGISNDNRDICAAAEAGNKRAQLAIEMQRYEILKFVGSYIAAMNGVDAIAFTGGIGENDPELRKSVCDNLSFVGVEIDDAQNKLRGKEVKISTDNSRVNVYVIPTNEELAIARDTLAIISK